MSGTELVAAIKSIHQGLSFVTPELASRLLTDAKGGALLPMREGKLQTALSYREQQILSHVSNGLTNKEVADRLGLSVGTITLRDTTVQKEERPQRLEAIQMAQQSELM